MSISDEASVTIPVEVLRLAAWGGGPAAERDELLAAYLGALDGLAPEAVDECLVTGLLHRDPGVRRRAYAAAGTLSPELAAEATGWLLGDPDEGVRAGALRRAAGEPALRALLDLLGRSPELIEAGEDGCVTVTDAQALATARSMLADRELVAALLAELPVPLSADRMPGRLSLAGMRHVPAGRLVRGGEASSWGDPAAPAVAEVQLPGFHLDTHPVTNDEYDAFVADVAERGHLWCHPDEPLDADHSRSTADDPRHAGDHPATGVSWYDAASYAAWCGKRLPTEDEWERAARGDDHRRHPWGGEFDPARARGLHAVVPDAGGDLGRQEWLRRLSDVRTGELPATTGPVGAHPGDESPSGVRDLCGNVWEWTSTRFLDGLPMAPRFGTMEPGELSGEWACEVSVRGGAWSSPPALLTAVARAGKTLTTRSPEIGFRCAVSEDEVVD